MRQYSQRPHLLVHVLICQCTYICTHCTCTSEPACGAVRVLSPPTQFEHYDPVDGRISERNFAKLVLSSASMNDQRKKKYIKRVKKVYGPVFCPESEVHVR